jgi:hypothetical protein
VNCKEGNEGATARTPGNLFVRPRPNTVVWSNGSELVLLMLEVSGVDVDSVKASFHIMNSLLLLCVESAAGKQSARTCSKVHSA